MSNDPHSSDLPPPLPGQIPPPLPSAELPPPLPNSTDPPPLPIAKPVVAKPVARAVPIKAEPPPSEPKAEASKPIPDRNDETDHHRARPQVKMALLVVGGVLLFGCCGISIVFYAFTQLTKQVAQVDRGPFTPVTVGSIPLPKTAAPQMKVNPPLQTTAPTPPRTQTPPPIATAPILTPPKRTVPSPQGMKNLQLYVSFDNETVREDRSRTKLGYQGVIHLVDGARNKAARPFVLPLRNEEGPKFHFTLSPDAFRFKDDSAFTVALWVRGGGTNGVAFALTQDTIDLGPKLLIKSSLRSVGVELFCDESDSEKKFVRAKSIPMQSISTPFYHIALTRSGDGTLTAYVDAVPITDAPEDSLPTKQPVAMKFKQAGFGLRPDSAAYTIELDEFCMFDRALSSDEIKTLAGKGSK